MKKLLLAILLIASAPLMAQIKSASLTASGLTCSMCSKAIYKALLKVPEIKGVSVDVEKSVYKVTFKENVSAMDQARVVQIIQGKATGLTDAEAKAFLDQCIAQRK